jgi:alpha-mannosidase
MRTWIVATLTLASVVLAATGVRTQEPVARKPAVYLVSTAHLDTQWNWTVQDTIRRFVPATFFENFTLFERFPHYTFTFEGAIHYMWFKEHYPQEWARVQKYVADGRWRLAGSWINAADTHVPSPEALMRQALYGRRFFREQFGRVSQDIYLPDCFGFGYALPAIGAASGIKAFSTQKLSWGAPFPPPFAIGRWKGVDGSTLLAALRPGDYVMAIKTDPSIDPKWTGDLVQLPDGRSIGFKYFGVGDVGGAIDPSSVEWVEKGIANPDAKVELRVTSADQLSRELTEKDLAALPEYDGELLLKTHGVGCYTSQSAMKAFNRQNELLADAAERASVASDLLTGLAYPRERLRTAWTRFLWHQFHDDLTGTSIPMAYQFSWNDELVSLNQFAGILTDAVRNVSASLDTRTKGIPLVVYNPVAVARQEPVEATVQFPLRAPAAVRVVDHSTGREALSQVLSVSGRSARILFLADVPSVGFKVFEVLPATAGKKSATLTATAASLESARYAAKLDANGDVSSIFDKELKTELLKRPMGLQLLGDESPAWPAWEILYESVTAAPRATFTNPRVRIVETGPVRATLEVIRTTAGSTLTQRISLTEGGTRVDVATDVDWKTPGMMLKAAFPLTAANRLATYDLGLGTIERDTNTANRYEVPAQQWADLTDASQRYGTAILNDSKYGWDKPDDNTLRLTLVRTPMPTKNFVYQSSNDIGRHHFTYSVAGHRGDWRTGRIPAQAAALNQPLVAFQTTAHGGPLGAALSLLTLTDQGNVAVRAIKKAEDSDEIVVRVQELFGQAGRTEVAMHVPIVSAREVNAAEELMRPAAVTGGKLAVNLARYGSRTFAVRLQEGPRPAAVRQGTVIPLPYNLDGFSTDANRKDGDFDGKGQTVAAELLPDDFQMHGVTFKFGAASPRAKNVLVPKGQSIRLPAGSCNRLYVLATAVGGDTRAAFSFARKAGAPTSATVNVQEWEGVVGQWNSRLVDDQLLRSVFVANMGNMQNWPMPEIQGRLVTRFDSATRTVIGLDDIRPGFVKRAEVALVATHRHAADGNQPYILSYVFCYALDVPKGATAIRLPANDKVRILAMTAAQESAPALTSTMRLYAADLGEPRLAAQAAKRPAPAAKK